MKYTYKDILNSLIPEKKKQDGTMTRYVYRPLSYPCAWVFLALGIKPNTVTAIGALCCLIAFVFVLTPVLYLHIAAIVLFFVFAILDCADGNMARTIGKKTVYGGWADAIGGYFAYATEIGAIGLSCWYFSSSSISKSLTAILPWGNVSWLLLGGITACSNILMRLIFQAKKNAEYASGILPTQGREKRFSEEIGITGYLPLLYLAGLMGNFLPAVLVCYSIVYIGGFFVTSLKHIHHIGKVDTHE